MDAAPGLPDARDTRSIVCTWRQLPQTLLGHRWASLTHQEPGAPQAPSCLRPCLPSPWKALPSTGRAQAPVGQETQQEALLFLRDRGVTEGPSPVRAEKQVARVEEAGGGGEPGWTQGPGTDAGAGPWIPELFWLPTGARPWAPALHGPNPEPLQPLTLEAPLEGAPGGDRE